MVSIPWMNSENTSLRQSRQQLINASMVEGIPEFGGYSVPEEYGAFLMDKSLENEIIRPRATVWAMGSETKKVPALTEQTEPTTYSAASRANGLKKDRQAHEKQPS